MITTINDESDLADLVGKRIFVSYSTGTSVSGIINKVTEFSTHMIISLDVPTPLIAFTGALEVMIYRSLVGTPEVSISVETPDLPTHSGVVIRATTSDESPEHILISERVSLPSGSCNTHWYSLDKSLEYYPHEIKEFKILDLEGAPTL